MTTMEFQNNHQSQISNTQNSHITSSEKDDQDKDQKPNSNLNKSFIFFSQVNQSKSPFYFYLQHSSHFYIC